MRASVAAAQADAEAGSTSGAAADPAALVLRRFRLVFNAVKTHFQQVEKRAGIGGAQLWALSMICAQPGIGVKALARAMDIHQTTTSNLVKALVAGGLVTAERKGPDRRTVQLHALPAATGVLRRAPGPFAGVLPQALAKLDGPTLQRLEHDLALLIEALGADSRGAHIPLAPLGPSAQVVAVPATVPSLAAVDPAGD